jgi:hypothetical protein
MRRGGLWRDGGGDVTLLLAIVFAGNYFDVLGVRPALGRLPEKNHDYSADSEPPIVLANWFWRERMGARSDIIGATMERTGKLFRVAAVLPPEFRGLEPMDSQHIWMPVGGGLAGTSTELRSRVFPGMPVVAVVALVLLVVCANAAIALLADAEARRGEIAMRLALGAGRLALLTQFAGESAVLACVAAVTYSGHLPLVGSGAGATISVVPQGAAPDAVPHRVYFNLVGPQFFEVTGASILRGRPFGDSDHHSGTPAAIINAEAGRRFWPSCPPRPCSGEKRYESRARR